MAPSPLARRRAFLRRCSASRWPLCDARRCTCDAATRILETTRFDNLSTCRAALGEARFVLFAPRIPGPFAAAGCCSTRQSL